MPSTYTLNNGIELIGTGEQSGTWGDTTNTNFELIDTALDGQVTVTLASAGSSGAPNTLPISDGSSSNGRNRMVIFDDGGDLGATAYVQLTPSDAEKIVYVRNDLSGSRSIILFQGTYNASNDYEVPAGTTAVVYFDGAGAGAVAANVFNNAYFDSLRLGSVSVTAILDEDDMASDSATALATQQSIKKYVDDKTAAQNELSEVLANGNTSGGTSIQMTTTDELQFRDTALKISSSADGQLDIDADTEIEIVAPTVDIDASTAMTIDTAALTVTGAVDLNTSLNVDGTITSDGLTVDGAAVVNGANMNVDNGYGYTWGSNAVQIYSDGNYMRFRTLSTDRIQIGNNGDITFYDTSGNASFVYDESAGSTFNEQGENKDFRVESDSNDHMLFVDAGNNQVNIGTSTNLGGLVNLSRTDGTFFVLNGTSNNKGYINWESNGFTFFTNGPAEAFRIGPSEMVVNEDGRDYDFRVESDTNQHMLFVDAANSHVNIGTATDLGGVLNVDGNVSLSGNAGANRYVALLSETDTYTGTLFLQAGGGSAGFGGAVTMYGHSHATYPGMVFIGSSSGSGGKVVIGNSGISYADSSQQITAYTDDSEVVINEASKNMDFRVESDNNTHALFVDASTDYVAIGHSGPSAILDVKSTTAVMTTLRGTAAGISYLDLTNYATSANGVGAGVEFRANSDTQERQVGFINAVWTDNTDATRDSQMQFYNNVNGSSNVALKLGPSETVFNEQSGDVNFRVESTGSANMLFVDAGNDRVSVGTASPSNPFHVYSILSTPTLIETNTTVARIAFKDSGTTDGNSVRLGSAGDALTMLAGNVERLRLSSTEAVFNDSGADTDFRVESDTNTHALFVDAGASRVGINKSSPSHALDVSGDARISNTSGTLLNLYLNGTLTSVPPSYGLLVSNAGATAGHYSPAIGFDIGGGGGTSSIFAERGSSAGGTLWFATDDSGSTMQQRVAINSAGSFKTFYDTVLNESGGDYDFRVESDNQSHMLFIDAANDVVSIAQASPVAKWLQIGGDVVTTIKPSVSISAPDDSGVNTSLVIRGGSPTIAFDQTAGGAGRILMDDSKVRFYTGTLDSTGTEVFTVGQGSGSETVANEGSINLDFRVESDNNSHMLYLDASVDRISMGTTSSSDATLTLQNAQNNGTLGHISEAQISTNGERAAMIEMITSVDTTSSGTQLTIPIFSQGGLWRQYQVKLMVVNGSYNINTDARGGSAIFSFTSLNVVRSFVQQEVTGNISSVEITANDSSACEVRVNFTNAYTGGGSSRNGVHVYAQVFGGAPSYFELDNATLN